MSTRFFWSALALGLSLLAGVPAAQAQRRPYIGYTYPAGGQQATTVRLKLGGQDLDGVNGITVTGTGVTARIVDYQRKLNPQEIQLLREQLAVLKKSAAAPSPAAMMADAAIRSVLPEAKTADAAVDPASLLTRVDRRIREWVQTPACSSISNIVFAEVTISPEAEAGPRELRVTTHRGVSNALVFHVGELFEYARKPMITASLHILGKEVLALRNRPDSEVEQRVSLPCTVNGQIAAREVNRYRFSATKGQRLVLSTQARQLIPYIADAVPGWFQPVLTLFDSTGREVAFADDYRFSPDPVILYQVEHDGEYVAEIRDSIYRGREDFIYRIAMGELPFITSIFPLGRTAEAVLPPSVEGWNLDDAGLRVLPALAAGGYTAAVQRMGVTSNRVPFVIERLPDAVEAEPNNVIAAAQKITLPVVVNGRIDRRNDVDVFCFTGKARTTVVVDIEARRLDSPLDSVVKITDAAGTVIAFNDDREDLTAGANTHPADSSLRATLPADGEYFVHIADTARQGGEEYGYRARISTPQPDFELRVAPSSLGLAMNTATGVNVYVARKDGFAAPIKIALKDPPAGLTAAPITLTGTQSVARLNLKAGPKPTNQPVVVTVTGSAKIGEEEVVREAIATEDRMQAFLWRHLVPASELQVLVFDPRHQPTPKRVPQKPATTAILAALPQPPPNVAASATASQPPAASPSSASAPAVPKPKFSKQQIAGRLQQLKLLFEEGLLTDEFYFEKVAECEASQ